MEERGYVCLQIKNELSSKVTYKICVQSKYPKKWSIQDANIDDIQYVEMSELCFSPTKIKYNLETELNLLKDNLTIGKIIGLFIQATEDHIYRPTITIKTLPEYLHLSKFEQVSKKGYVKFKNSSVWEKSNFNADLCTHVLANRKMEYIRTDEFHPKSFQYLYRVKVEYDFDSIFKEIPDDVLVEQTSEGQEIYPLFYLDIGDNGPGYHFLKLGGLSPVEHDSKMVTNKKRDITKLTPIIPFDEIDVNVIDELMDIIFLTEKIKTDFQRFCYQLMPKTLNTKGVGEQSSLNASASVSSILNERSPSMPKALNTSASMPKALNTSASMPKALNTFTDNEDDMSIISATRLINELTEYLGKEYIEKVDTIDYRFESIYKEKKSVILVNPSADVYRSFSASSLFEWKSKHHQQFRYDNTTHIISNTFLFHLIKWICSYKPLKMKI